MTFTYVPAIDLTDRALRSDPSPVFAVTLSSGRTVEVTETDFYEPEGPLTTFFRSGSATRTIDVWSERVASFRTAEIVSICQSDVRSQVHPSAQNLDGDRPALTVVPA